MIIVVVNLIIFVNFYCKLVITQYQEVKVPWAKLNLIIMKLFIKISFILYGIPIKGCHQG